MFVCFVDKVLEYMNKRGEGGSNKLKGQDGGDSRMEARKLNLSKMREVIAREKRLREVIECTRMM